MTNGRDDFHDPSACLGLIKELHAQGGSLAIAPAELFAPVNLGRPKPAQSFEQTPADILRRAEAQGAAVSHDLLAYVAADELQRAARLALRKRKPGAGRRSKKTQYDTWADRRRGLHHRLVRLPAAGRAAGWEVQDRYTTVLESVFMNPSVPDRHKAFEVIRMLARKGIPAPARRTIDRHLKKLSR